MRMLPAGGPAALETSAKLFSSGFCCIRVKNHDYISRPASNMSFRRREINLVPKFDNRTVSPAPDSGSDVMDEYEAAKYVGVCDKTLRKLRKESDIPYARVGGRIVYLRRELYAWLAAGGTSQHRKAG